MSENLVEMPVGIAARLLLSGVVPSVCDSLREAFVAHIDGAISSQADAIRLFEQVRGGPSLPFELTADERLIGRAFAMGTVGSYRSNTAIFSNLARVDAGALVMKNAKSVEYLDDSAPELPDFDSWLYPAAAGSYRAKVGSLSTNKRHATFALGKNLEIQVPTSANETSGYWRVSIFDRTFANVAVAPLTGVDVQAQSGTQTLLVRIVQPETVLRISAAAELENWLYLEHEGVRIYVRLRPLSAPGTNLPFLSSARWLEHTFAYCAESRKLAVKRSVWEAAWPAARFEWSTLDPRLMQGWSEAGLLPS